MKAIKFILSPAFFLIAGTLIAQTPDPIPSRKIIEEGTKGDIILGKEYRKKQLLDSPQLLNPDDSTQKNATVVKSKKKKCRHRKCNEAK